MPHFGAALSGNLRKLDKRTVKRENKTRSYDKGRSRNKVDSNTIGGSSMQGYGASGGGGGSGAASANTGAAGGIGGIGQAFFPKNPLLLSKPKFQVGDRVVAKYTFGPIRDGEECIIRVAQNLSGWVEFENYDGHHFPPDQFELASMGLNKPVVGPYLWNVGDFVEYKGAKDRIMGICDDKLLLKSGAEIPVTCAVPWTEPAQNWTQVCEEYNDKYGLD